MAVPQTDASVNDESLRVLVAADYPSVRAGLIAMLESAGVEVTADTVDAMLQRDRQDGLDVAVVDVGEALEAVLEELDSETGLPAVLLVDGPSGRIAPDGEQPARAWLRRDAGEEELLAAVRAVAAGLAVYDPGLPSPLPVNETAAVRAGAEPDGLTDREVEVLELLAAGLTNRAIAVELGISEHTAKYHVGAILSKLGVAGRTEAAIVAARRGLIPL